MPGGVGGVGQVYLAAPIPILSAEYDRNLSGKNCHDQNHHCWWHLVLGQDEITELCQPPLLL